MSRLKIYQTVVTAAAVSYIQYGVSSELIPAELADSATVAVTLALFTLYALSFVTRRLVGLVGYNHATRTVKLARMTFWGNRQDLFVALENIVPLSEMNVSPSDLFTDIKTYDNQVKLFISLRFGGIMKPELFELIFGSLKEKN